MPFSIDFGEIRPYEGDRRTGFEGAFRRIEGAGGDGGVEGYFPRPSGSKIGYQAKYLSGDQGYRLASDRCFGEDCDRASSNARALRRCYTLRPDGSQREAREGQDWLGTLGDAQGDMGGLVLGRGYGSRIRSVDEIRHRRSARLEPRSSWFWSVLVQQRNF